MPMPLSSAHDVAPRAPPQFAAFDFVAAREQPGSFVFCERFRFRHQANWFVVSKCLAVGGDAAVAWCLRGYSPATLGDR